MRTSDELRRIDRCLQPVRWAAFFTIGVYLVAFGRFSRFVTVVLLAATALVQIVTVFRLARALKFSRTLMIGRCVLCLVPTICFISLVGMMSDASEALNRRA